MLSATFGAKHRLMSLDTITINSINIPRIGFGTYKLTGADGQKAIEEALAIGYRHLDTARMYKNEEEVGKAIANSGIAREDIFITTKVWPTEFSNVVAAAEDSLRKLKVDRVDLLLLHWPSDPESNKTAVAALNDIVRNGYARSVGVSNFNIEQLELARPEAPIICNQVEYHPYLSQAKLLAYLREYDMFLAAYRPLAIGKVATDETLLAIGDKYKKSAGQVTLRWMMQQDSVVALPKSSHKDRIIENLDIFDFELSEEEMTAINALARHERVTEQQLGAKWD
jgi:2,5-diketo-D-gluconate reductase B